MPAIKENKINDHKITVPETLIKKQLSNGLFLIEDPNIFILAKKESGKTLCVKFILEKICDENTIVIFFASQFFNDKSYKIITDMLKEKDVPYIAETSFNDKKGKSQLQKLLNYLKTQNLHLLQELDPFYGMDEDSEEENEEEDVPAYELEEGEEPPRLVIVIDDMSDETRHNAKLKALLKANRHMKATVILSTQAMIDVQNDCLNQMQYVLAFAKIPEDKKNNKLLKLYSELALSIPYEEFKALYDYATAPNTPGEKSHNFLFIDVSRGQFRKNFDIALEIGTPSP